MRNLQRREHYQVDEPSHGYHGLAEYVGRHNGTHLFDCQCGKRIFVAPAELDRLVPAPEHDEAPPSSR